MAEKFWISYFFLLKKKIQIFEVLLRISMTFLVYFSAQFKDFFMTLMIIFQFNDILMTLRNLMTGVTL